MKIKCLIIDDEPLAQKGITEYVNDVEFLELCGVFENALKAVDIIHQKKIDLLFLDIQMPRISGLEFLKALQDPPLVILTTAYPQYALESYELDVLDYLVKPISFPRFLRAVTKAKEHIEARTTHANMQEAGDHIFIKSDNRIVKILFSDILYVEALQNYICIHTPEKRYISYLTFKSIEESLPKDLFLKVHKSYIVQLAKVEAIEGNQLQVSRFTIPISRNNKEEVLQRLIAGKFLKR
ncbi:MAG TPA: LytTR family DNA-binding domain-containing protein [Parafilimonas sp.]|nr:LytTR family DNA-binding domain-containing protein [Parafilimonas sp.]